jgi:hypothetical protein
MFAQIIILAYLFVGSAEAFADPVITASHLQTRTDPTGDLEKESAKDSSSRKMFFAKTGLVVVPKPQIPSDYFLDSLAIVMSNGLSNDVQKKLTRLQYVIADDSISKNGVEAYYSHKLNALIIGKTSAIDSSSPKHYLARTWSVIAHEIGHAYVISNLSAERLALLARRFGPWRFANFASTDHLLSPQFFRPHPLFGAHAGAIYDVENAPSRYALQNVHEWFAECFSTMIQEKLRRQGLFPELRSSSDVNARPLSAALQSWFYENITR